MRLTRKHALDELKKAYEHSRARIRQRLREFSGVSPQEYFYELLYCLLTPQSSALHADRAIARLKELRFQQEEFDPEPILREPAHYIRFHKTKARYLLRVRKESAAIMQQLNNGLSAKELREWLVNNVQGLGYKEATHFLRNIGKNDGLAILDRHILRNLKRYGIIRSLPQALTKNRYIRVEKQFQRFAHRVGIPIDELDLLFWSMETGEIRK